MHHTTITNKLCFAFAVIGLFFSKPMFAQQQNIEKTNHEKIRLGLKGSFNLTTFNNIKNSKVDSYNIGYSVGLFAKLPLLNKLAVQPELYVVTKGATVGYNETIVYGAAKYKLNYLELPVFLVYNITPNFNVHTGPYAGILISGKTSNKNSNQVFDFENNIDQDNYNRMDAGLAIGSGIDIGAIGIGLRYYQGLSTVGKQKTYTGFNYTFPNAMNSVISAYATISLN